jgi:hypothetical protein
MNFALDFDNTFTADEPLWCKFIAHAETSGHKVYIVTCRRDTEENRLELFGVETLPEQPSSIIARSGLPMWRYFFTGLSGKAWFMQNRGIKIDVWIDDEPSSIVYGR